jgi:anhydro-N-acetylmuramic acid kinase
MSGTSCDGIAAAMVDIAARGGAEVLAYRTFPYPAATRAALLDLCRVETARVDDICHWNVALGELLAAAVVRLARTAVVEMATIDLVGSHGQTIHHLPGGRADGLGRRRVGSTLQIGEPCVIAERTGITTIADFRPRDMAAGGQGAPLVPYADWKLFAHPRRGRAMQNIGGIANVTYLPAGCGIDGVVAFDTGPGNMIIDRMTQLATGGRQAYDRGGRLAARGRVRLDLLAEWMRHPYFRRRPPKSTGREEFGVGFADEMFDRACKGLRGACGACRMSAPQLDVLATATAFTAESIADAYRRFLGGRVDEVIVSGGGAHNATLMAMLTERLAPAEVTTSGRYGLHVEAKEAVAFAILAAETYRGRCANVPTATGAGRGVVLGKIVPGGGR